MSQLQINETFKEDYLTCGRTRDNFIFENCPIEFMENAKDLLSKSCDEVKSCVVTIDRAMENGFLKTLNKCSNDLQEKSVARDLVASLIIRELLKGEKTEEFPEEELDKGIDALLCGNFGEVKEYHFKSPFPYDVARLMKKVGKIELNIFLENTQNVQLQQAVNIFISSREPYSVKIFTNNERLPSYYDQTGNLIQSPHDYMTRNVREFIEFEEEKE